MNTKTLLLTGLLTSLSLTSASAAPMGNLGKAFLQKIVGISDSARTLPSQAEQEAFVELMGKYELPSKFGYEYGRGRMLKLFRNNPEQMAKRFADTAYETPIRVALGKPTTNLMLFQEKAFWKVFDIGNVEMREKVFHKIFLSPPYPKKSIYRDPNFKKRIDFFTQQNIDPEVIGVSVFNKILKTDFSLLGAMGSTTVEFWDDIAIRKFFAELSERGTSLAKILDHPGLSFAQANSKTVRDIAWELLWKLNKRHLLDYSTKPQYNRILALNDHGIDEKAMGIFLSKAWPHLAGAKTIKGFLEATAMEAHRENKIYQALLIAADRNEHFLSRLR